MNMVKFILLNGTQVWINPDSVCDIRKDPMNDEYTLIQLNQGFHKVKLTIDEVLNILKFLIY